MNCKKCGKSMPNGARFCISCGAEHDANGELITSSGQVDYNKTIMIDDVFSEYNENAKIDYNKTVMSNDSINSGKVDYNKTVMANDFVQHDRVDYNKTMMANDVPRNESIDYNKTMMATDIPQNNLSNQRSCNNNVSTTTKKKKVSPALLIVLIVFVLAGVAGAILLNKKKEVNKDIHVNSSELVAESKMSDSTVQTDNQAKLLSETTETGNVVSDFNPNADGYWTKDEVFMKNGVPQKNMWVPGDFYVGADGRKVRNQFIDDTYYVDANGKKVKNEWYKEQRKIGTGEVTVWYYLGPDGAKWKDRYTPDGFYVDKDGIYVQKDNDIKDSPHYIPNKK